MPTGGQLLVEGLRRWGVDTVFGLPGVQLDGFFDALAGDGTLRVVHTRHEQATSYMADGYARATGRVGVCAVVPGPGILNAGAGLANAYATNSPVLCIAGQLFGGDRWRTHGALHEIPDQTAVLRGTIGSSARALHASDVPALLDAAFVALRSPGRRRPTALELGPDVLLGETDATYGPLPTLPGPKAPSAAEVEEAAARLVDVRRPLIWAGGGALEAGEGLRALAEALAAPIALGYNARGALSDREPWVLPPSSGYALLPGCDALVIVGSRFFGNATPPRVPDGVPVVRIDVDPGELANPVVAATTIEADANLGALALAEALVAARPLDAVSRDAERARVGELRQSMLGALAARYPDTHAFASALRRAMPEDAILVDEMTQVAYYARNGFPVYAPRTHIGSGYQGTLGFGYCTSLGVKVGRPDVPVVSINGDGGFLYGVGELATAVQHGIAVVAVVFDDGAYGNVKRIQGDTYGREIASTLRNPDFAALGRAFGMRGEAVDDAAGLERAVASAIAAQEPALIRAPIGVQPDAWAVLGGRVTLI